MFHPSYLPLSDHPFQYFVLLVNLKGRDHSEDLGVDGKIILE
jgi:hypothetical protein